MKTELILPKIFILIFLASCNAAEQDKAKAADRDKFILTGRVENAGDLETIQVDEGETASHSIELDNNGEFNFEGSAPDATLYTLFVEQRPFMLIVKDGEDI